LPIAKKHNKTPALVPKHVSLSLDERGGLRLAVVADTHSRPHPKTNALLAALAPDAIVHAGDIGDLEVLSALERVAPVIAVRGNIDERASHLPDAVVIDLRTGPRVGEQGEVSGESALKLLLMHIAVYGPKVRADAARLAGESGARLILCGHSHVPFIGRDRGLTLFNPGSCGPRRMHLPILFGMLTIEQGKLSLQHIDCETGLPWAP
jgi:putative phosphoesterase